MSFVSEADVWFARRLHLQTTDAFYFMYSFAMLDIVWGEVSGVHTGSPSNSMFKRSGKNSNLKVISMKQLLIPLHHFLQHWL